MSWLLAFLGFAVLIVLHEAGHFAAAKAVGMRVERFALFFPPLLARTTRGETEYAIGLIPLGGYVKISGMNPSEELPDEVRTRAYWAQPAWKRIVVIGAGPAVNLLLAFFGLLLYFGVIGVGTLTNEIGMLQKGLPAQGVVRPDDRLVAVDGRRGTPAELREVIEGHRCAGTPRKGCLAATPVELTLGRGGREVTERLRPVYVPVPSPNEGESGMRLGFTFERGPRETFPLGTSLSYSATTFGTLTWETLKLPLRVFDAERRKDISGPVGSYEVTRQVIILDASRAVFILSVISLSLAVVNLFPFLPLDGGHIFWAVVERVRGRPVSYALMERSSVVGFVLVLGLFAIGFTNDIDRLTGEGFGVR